MNNQEKMLKRRVQAAMDYLYLAAEQINMIKKEYRTEEADTYLNQAADSIFEARETLKKVETDQYISDFVSENVKTVMRHRKKKENQS